MSATTTSNRLAGKDEQTNRQMQYEAQLETARNVWVGGVLRPISLGLGILYAVIAVSYLLGLPKDIALQTAAVAEVTAFLLLGLALLLSRKKVSPRWSHTLGAAVAGLVLLNSLLPIHLTSDPRQTIQLVLLIAGAGFFFLSSHWLVIVFLASFSGWALVVWAAPPSNEWVPFGILMVVAAVLSIAVHIERVRTINQLESLKLQDNRRRSELEAVLVSTEEAQRSLATSMAIGQRITSILDLDVLLNQVCDLLKERYKCNFVGIFLLDEDNQHLVARAGTGEAGKSMVRDGFKLRIGQDGIVGWVGAKGRPALADEVTQDSRYISFEGLEETLSELAIPLEMGRTLLGVLDMQSEQTGHFREDDIPFLQLIADQAAIALQNARYYEEINQFNQELENKIFLRTEALQGAYEHLERLDRTKSDFISIASHELRTPITIIQGYSQMLLEDPGIQQNPIQMQVAAGIQSGANRLNEIVGSLLDSARISSQAFQLHPSPIIISTLIEFTCSRLVKSIEDRHQSLVLESLSDLPQIEADPDALRKVFHHLLVNAIKYTPDGGKILISARELPGAVEIVVRDTGIGIDPSLHELIFQKFYQTGEVDLHSSGMIKFKGGGPGLGLAIARGIVEAHKGRIWVESSGYDEKACPGSSFHVLLPLR
jgi:signal transduction histidine kinase/uncharacterized membrane protein